MNTDFKNVILSIPAVTTLEPKMTVCNKTGDKVDVFHTTNEAIQHIKPNSCL